MSAGRRAHLPARPLLLVIDSEEVRSATLKRALESGGYDVETTGAVRHALSAVVRTRPSAVILGALPPEMRISAVGRQLRSAALTSASLPIVVIEPVAPVDEPRLPDIYQLPVPFDMARLRSLLATLIARPAADAPRGAWVAHTLEALPRDLRPMDGPDPPWPDDVPAHRLFDALEDGLALVDAQGRVLWTNRAAGRLFGAATGSLEGRLLQDLLPDDASPLPATGPAVDGTWFAAVGRATDGRDVDVDVCFRAVPDPAEGRTLVTIRNAAPRKQAEQALQSNSDLREQLHRSQRIGALGRLSGGLAHDFNNLLQVIGGYAEALASDHLDAATRRRIIGLVQTAAERASSLTRQLLAFGRRQVLVPQVVDLNAIVLATDEMLRRLIGEDVQLVRALASDLPRVRVDPGQMEQALLNLALNARDAMPHGGTLELTTASLSLVDTWSPATMPAAIPPGDWVLLSVRDTGTGMDPDTVAQAFEPFFTTKDPSKGSGLGLSMVYGIVKQSGGYTWLDSAPGAGTSVHVLLPALDGHPDMPVSQSAGRRTAGHSPTGTILLVEDDGQVRSLFAAFLRHAGHVVIEAADGREALERFEAHRGAVDVLVTDVVMPHMSGPALAKALRARRPSLKVLFVSGYNDPVGTDADSGTAQLAKPVTRLALLDQIAQLLTPPPTAAD